MPRNYFPFAAEGRGDYFFVDTSTPDGKVYLYRHDTVYEDERLVPLNPGVDEF